MLSRALKAVLSSAGISGIVSLLVLVGAGDPRAPATSVWISPARTAFRFADFGLRIPRVASVPSVEDNIRLETDLLLRRSP